jgi:hypothetical protein
MQRFGNSLHAKLAACRKKGARVHGDGVQPSDLTGCARFGRHTRPNVGDAEGASAEAAGRDRFPDTHRAHLATLSRDTSQGKGD